MQNCFLESGIFPHFFESYNLRACNRKPSPSLIFIISFLLKDGNFEVFNLSPYLKLPQQINHSATCYTYRRQVVIITKSGWYKSEI